jgi:argininosuccinate lyase
VEEVNKLVSAGIPYRDAYKKIGMDIESGKFSYDTNISHSHEGSIGNLGTEEIKKQMQKLVASFPFTSIHTALNGLVE